MNYVIRSASLDITHKCNLRCKHCYNRSGESAGQELSLPELLQLSKQLAALQLDSFCVCGGEPLLRVQDAIYMIDELKASSPRTVVSLVSNGLLLTDDTAHALKTAGLDRIQFSLDGLSNASYKMIRGIDNGPEMVKEAVDIAQEANLEVMIAALPHKGNYHEFEEMITTCSSWGVSELRAQPLMPLGRGADNYRNLLLNKNELKQIRHLLATATCQSMRIEWGDPIDHFFMLQEASYLPMITLNHRGDYLVTPYLPYSIWSTKKGSVAEYLQRDIPKMALRHKDVKQALESVMSVADMQTLATTHSGQIVDISDKLQ